MATVVDIECNNVPAAAASVLDRAVVGRLALVAQAETGNSAPHEQIALVAAVGSEEGVQGGRSGSLAVDSLAVLVHSHGDGSHQTSDLADGGGAAELVATPTAIALLEEREAADTAAAATATTTAAATAAAGSEVVSMNPAQSNVLPGTVGLPHSDAVLWKKSINIFKNCYITNEKIFSKTSCYIINHISYTYTAVTGADNTAGGVRTPSHVEHRGRDTEGL